jgi:hypothetical protein
MRTSIVMAHAALLALAGAAFACNLQSSGLGPQNSTDTGSSPRSAGSTPDTEDTPDASVHHDGSTSGTEKPTGADDASAPIDPNADAEADPIEPDAHVLTPDAGVNEGGDPCDMDEDGHRATREGCGGDDCCDYDSRARPGQTAFFSTPTACGTFDFDCNGSATTRFPVAACKLGFFTCSGDGFAKPAACGTVSEYVSCGWAGLHCSESAKDRAQACR